MCGLVGKRRKPLRGTAGMAGDLTADALGTGFICMPGRRGFAPAGRPLDAGLAGNAA